MGLVSTWLPFLNSQIMQRWFESGNFIWLSPVPLLAVTNAVLLWRDVMRRREVAPFVLALCFFALGFVGLLLGIWPNLLPPSLSIWEAAAAPYAGRTYVYSGWIVQLCGGPQPATCMNCPSHNSVSIGRRRRRADITKPLCAGRTYVYSGWIIPLCGALGLVPNWAR